MRPVDSKRLVHLALGVPDAIASARRDEAAVSLLWDLVGTPGILSPETDARIDAAVRKSLRKARELLDDGSLDRFMLSKSDHALEAEYPSVHAASNRRDLTAYLVRAIVAYAKAHPVLDEPPASAWSRPLRRPP